MARITHLVTSDTTDTLYQVVVYHCMETSPLSVRYLLVLNYKQSLRYFDIFYYACVYL
jgi:hypothetical protein